MIKPICRRFTRANDSCSQEMLSSDAVISATYDHQGLHNLPAHANIFFQVTTSIILSTVATQKTQLLAAGRITYTEHPPCREELLCSQSFALVFYTWSSPILSYGKVKLRTGFKTPLRCGVLILGFDSDYFKADTVTDNYTMVTSQGLLLWLWPQRTTASIPWKMEKCLVKIPFPIRSSLFLQCFCWYFVIFKDWVYFLPVYSQPFNSILLLLQMCREGGLDTHQVHRTMQNTFFFSRKNGKQKLSFTLKDDPRWSLKIFLPRSDTSPVRDRSGVQELQAGI